MAPRKPVLDTAIGLALRDNKVGAVVSRILVGSVHVIDPHLGRYRVLSVDRGIIKIEKVRRRVLNTEYYEPPIDHRTVLSPGVGALISGVRLRVTAVQKDSADLSVIGFTSGPRGKKDKKAFKRAKARLLRSGELEPGNA